MHKKAKTFPIRTFLPLGCVWMKNSGMWEGLWHWMHPLWLQGKSPAPTSTLRTSSWCVVQKKQHWGPREQPSKSYKYLWKTSHAFVREEKMLVGSMFPWWVLGEDLTLTSFFVWWHLAVMLFGGVLFCLRFLVALGFFLPFVSGVLFVCFIFLFCF